MLYVLFLVGAIQLISAQGINYNLPTGVSSFGGWLTYLNTATNGYFGTGFCIALFIIALIGLSYVPNILIDVMVSGYATGIIASFFALGSWVSPYLPFTFAIVGGVAMMILIWNNNNR